jgi:cell division protein FtsW
MSRYPQAIRRHGPETAISLRRWVDPALAVSVLCLVGLGLVMVASASMGIAERATGDPFYYLTRQLVYVALGAVAATVVYQLPLGLWERINRTLLLGAVVLLILVLIPGIGKTVNGASRWLWLGVFNLQVSEPTKLVVILYLAGYLVRHRDAVRTRVASFFRPLLVLAVIAALLLLEPDFGTAAVLMATAFGMLFLGGVRLWHFALLLAGAVATLTLLAVSSPYRLERLTGFLDPWAHPFDSGFQLTQSLIAIGSGAWFGLGLGESIQKLFYLPEAHTDFLFAVLAEELGLVGVVTVIALFALLVWRCFVIARRAEAQGMLFGAYVAYGIGIWLGLQAIINMGVNMGVLPTKGLTLPMMSAGGSSMLVVCAAIGLLARIHVETGRAVLPCGTPREGWRE